MKLTKHRNLFIVMLSLVLAFSMIPLSVFAATPADSATDVAKIGETGYTTLPAAVDAAKDGDTITLLKDVTLKEGVAPDTRYNLYITKDVTIDGAGHTITNGLERGIGVESPNVTFKNVTIENAQTNGRCIDTRANGNFSIEQSKEINIDTLTLDSVILRSNGKGNPQTVTIGGYQETNANVIIKNSSLITGKDGYCIIMFNPVNMTITGTNLQSANTDTELYGWGVLYFKGPSGSTGTSNSKITVKDSRIFSVNPNSGLTNSFGVVVFEDVHDNTVTLDGCEIDVSTNGNQTQELVCFSNAYKHKNNVCKITGSTKVNIGGLGMITDKITYESEKTAGNKIIIDSGRFKKTDTTNPEYADPTPYLAEGLTEKDVHKNGDGSFSVSDINFDVSFKGASVTLDEKVGVNFGVEIQNASPDDYMVFEVNGKLQKAPLGEPDTVTGMYTFTCDTVAKEMGDTITATVYTNGKPAKTVTYSVKEYAKKVLETTKDDKTQTMVKSMLNYGAMAQEYFGHQTGDLANSILTDADKVLDTSAADTALKAKTMQEVTNNITGIKTLTAALNLESAVGIKFYLTTTDDISAYTFTYKKGAGPEIALTPFVENGKYCVEIPGLYAANFQEDYVLTITAGGKTTTVTYGVYYYGNQVVNNTVPESLKNLVYAMYEYGQAAAAITANT